MNCIKCSCKTTAYDFGAAVKIAGRTVVVCKKCYRKMSKSELQEIIEKEFENG